MPRGSDLEFHVSAENSVTTEIYTNFGKACLAAVSKSVQSGLVVRIDVITWTRAAARKWGGDEAIRVYEDDPEASVHERIVVKAEATGHVA